MGQVTEQQFEFSDEELLQFLADIEAEDQDVEEAEFEEADELDAAIEEKPKVYNADKAYAYAQRRKDKIRKIKEQAFEQKIIDLQDYISKEHAQLIVETLCRSFDSIIARYENYVIKRCNSLLAAKIPRSLRACYKTYSRCFIRPKSFIYVVPTIDEQPMFMVIPLDIPYYFEQGTEQAVIESLGVTYYSKLNDAIAKVYSYKAQKRQAEATYTIKIAKLPRCSYLELLKVYPFWFDLLIKALTSPV